VAEVVKVYRRQEEEEQPPSEERPSRVCELALVTLPRGTFISVRAFEQEYHYRSTAGHHTSALQSPIVLLSHESAIRDVQTSQITIYPDLLSDG
jgi:hypothetical protein